MILRLACFLFILVLQLLPFHSLAGEVSYDKLHTGALLENFYEVDDSILVAISDYWWNWDEKEVVSLAVNLHNDSLLWNHKWITKGGSIHTINMGRDSIDYGDSKVSLSDYYGDLSWLAGAPLMVIQMTRRVDGEDNNSTMLLDPRSGGFRTISFETVNQADFYFGDTIVFLSAYTGPAILQAFSMKDGAELWRWEREMKKEGWWEYYINFPDRYEKLGADSWYESLGSASWYEGAPSILLYDENGRMSLVNLQTGEATSVEDDVNKLFSKLILDDSLLIAVRTDRDPIIVKAFTLPSFRQLWQEEIPRGKTCDNADFVVNYDTASGLLLVGTDQLSAIDASSGALLWTTELKKSTGSAGCHVGDSNIVVRSVKNIADCELQIFLLRRSDGAIARKVDCKLKSINDTPVPLSLDWTHYHCGAPVVDSGTMLVLADRLYSFPLNAVGTSWQYDKTIDTVLSITDERIWAVGDGKLIQMDMATGKELYKSDQRLKSGVIFVDSLLLARVGNSLVCLHCQKAQELWRLDGKFSGQLVYKNNATYATMDNHVARIDAADGNVDWQSEGIIQGEFMLDTGVVYANLNGLLTALIDSTGNVLWQTAHKHDGYCVFIASGEGRLIALYPGDFNRDDATGFYNRTDQCKGQYTLSCISSLDGSSLWQFDRGKDFRAYWFDGTHIGMQGESSSWIIDVDNGAVTMTDYDYGLRLNKQKIVRVGDNGKEIWKSREKLTSGVDRTREQPEGIDAVYLWDEKELRGDFVFRMAPNLLLATTGEKKPFGVSAFSIDDGAVQWSVPLEEQPRYVHFTNEARHMVVSTDTELYIIRLPERPKK